MEDWAIWKNNGLSAGNAGVTVPSCRECKPRLQQLFRHLCSRQVSLARCELGPSAYRKALRGIRRDYLRRFEERVLTPKENAGVYFSESCHTLYKTKLASLGKGRIKHARLKHPLRICVSPTLLIYSVHPLR